MSREQTTPRRRSSRGFTLAEVLVVIALMAVVTVSIGSVSRQLPSVKLKRSSVALISAIRTAFARATITSKSLRIAMDFEEGSFAIEEASAPMLVQSKDITKNGGAAAVTDAERVAQAEADRVSHGFVAPKPRFKVIDELCSGVKDPTKPRTGRAGS